MNRLRGLLAWFLVAAGAAATGYPAFAYGTGAIRQARLAAEVRTLLGPEAPPSAVESRRSEALSEGEPIQMGPSAPARTEPSGKVQEEQGVGSSSSPSAARRQRPPAEGQALGVLEIPSIGVSVVVLEGVSDPTLLAGPGHLPWTALPGSNDVSVVAGHRDMHFRSLKDLAMGGRVTLRLPGRSIAYRVTDREVVDPDARWVTISRHRPILRLVTCWPPDFVGPAPQRLVVSAVPFESAAPTGPAEGTSASASVVADAPEVDGWLGGPDGSVQGPATAGPSGQAHGSGDMTGPDGEAFVVSATDGDIVPASTLPWIGAAGAALAILAAFGAWRTRRRLLWWSLPWLAGLGLSAWVLLAAWGGPQVLAAR